MLECKNALIGLKILWAIVILMEDWPPASLNTMHHEIGCYATIRRPCWCTSFNSEVTDWARRHKKSVSSRLQSSYWSVKCEVLHQSGVEIEPAERFEWANHKQLCEVSPTTWRSQSDRLRRGERWGKSGGGVTGGIARQEGWEAAEQSEIWSVWMKKNIWP